MKTCTKCGEVKEFSDFVKDKSKKDGHSSYCKNCKKQRYILLKSDNLLQLEKEIKSSIILENKILLKDGKKLCSHCKQIFKIEDLKGRRCRECCNYFSIKWSKNNKDKMKDISKKYRDNNSEKVKKSIQVWRDNNSEKMTTYRKEYYLKKKLEKEQQILLSK